MALIISPPKYEYLYGVAWTVGKEDEREGERSRRGCYYSYAESHISFRK